jgi:hypothetical protein
VLLNGLAPRVPRLVTEDEPTLWDREIALLMRDNPVMTKDTAERRHHAPLVERRRDGTVARTAELLRANGFDVDDELWTMDAADCSPCDNKVPDSH